MLCINTIKVIYRGESTDVKCDPCLQWVLRVCVRDVFSRVFGLCGLRIRLCVVLPCLVLSLLLFNEENTAEPPFRCECMDNTSPLSQTAYIMWAILSYLPLFTFVVQVIRSLTSGITVKVGHCNEVSR